MSRILKVDGERIEVNGRSALMLATPDGPPGERYTCGHRIVLSGDPYYQASDGRTWCFSCFCGLVER